MLLKTVMMTECFLEHPCLCAESIIASPESPHCRAPPGLSFIPLGEGLGLLPLLHFEPDLTYGVSHRAFLHIQALSSDS